MEVGDLALGYRQRSIVCASLVVAKHVSAEIGKLAWPDEIAEPYAYLFFLTSPVSCEVPVEDYPNYFGKVYQGIRRLPSSTKILRDYGSFEEFVRTMTA